MFKCDFFFFPFSHLGLTDFRKLFFYNNNNKKKLYLVLVETCANMNFSLGQAVLS